MLKQHATLVYRLLLTVDITITVISFFVGYWIRNSYFGHGELARLYPLGQYTWLLLIILPVWAILLNLFKAYRSYRTSSLVDEVLALAKAVILGGLVISAIAFGLKLHYLSRTFILSFIVANIVLLGMGRFTIRMLSWMARRRGYNFRNVVIVGTGGLAIDIASRVQNYSHWGLRIVGLVSESESVPKGSVGGLAVIGSLADLEAVVTSSAVDEVIFAVSGVKMQDLEDTFLMLEDHGINARMVANMFPHLIAKVRMDDLESVPLLTFSTLPDEPLLLMIKRVLDVVISAMLMIAALPIMAVAAAVIRLSSSGPVLFKQKRAGLHGRIFTLYKFRSMYADAEMRKAGLEKLNEMGGPVFKIKDDPRVTPVGRFIRKTSIDELPQLWNVLKGDMSIVGPRPPLPEEVGKYARWQRRRLSMRPGLTCLWQISGRNKITDFDEWARLDLQYIDTWSLALDLKIFLKTIPVVLFQRGAS